MGDIKKSSEEQEEKKSPNEERIRKICLLYYSRPDIRKAMYDFSKNRECVPRYFEGFGKRPDSFQYDSDILELAKKGATSFHSSEELWEDPLQISTELKENEIKALRQGWDLLIDIDSKYLDYSKIYAEILIEVLKSHGIKNIGVKFSGSKGLHIIVPWKAFPKEISGKKTSDMFPEWPRLICQYLNSKIAEKLKDRIIDSHDNANEASKMLEIYCNNCKGNIAKKSKIFFLCPSCKTQIQNIQTVFERKRKIRCPNCQIEMEELRREEILICEKCSITSEQDKDNFKERVQSKHIDADLVLVSPRHLFRMPYSLHEKTSLASVVISADKIKDFDPRQANPLTITPKNFMPDSEEGEASYLLRCALEFKPLEEEKSSPVPQSSGEKKFKEITLTNINPENYPPTIKRILAGMESDGRKRGLFILLSFFKSLKYSDEEIKYFIEEWNKKNYEPLKSGYIKAQLSWYAKAPAKMPPNFDKTYYKEIGFPPTQEELQFKNPVSYVIKKSLGVKKPNYGKR
jgi:DNA primase catalytic subunit